MTMLKAIGKYLAILLSFFAAAIGAGLILIAICAILDLIGLTNIPFIGWLRDNYIDGLPILGAIAGYSASAAVTKKLSGYPSLFAVGVTIAVLHTVFLVVNLLNRDIISVFTNICMIISAIILIYDARDAIGPKNSNISDHFD